MSPALPDTLLVFPVWRDSALAAVPPMVTEPGALLWVIGMGAVVGAVVFLGMFATSNPRTRQAPGDEPPELWP